MTSSATQRTIPVRLCLFSHRAALFLCRLLLDLWTGFWLGWLNSAQQQAVGEAYYSQKKAYRSDHYNRSGWHNWERRILEDHFGGCSRLLVAAAGGGREVLAAKRTGRDVEGFECHPELVAYANEFLEREGFGTPVRHSPPDQCPSYPSLFDGAVIGWGAYIHIAGRKRRVAFLQSLRASLCNGAPLLVSFYFRRAGNSHYRRVFRLGDFIRRALGRDRPELGDSLIPAFVHYFTREELADELKEAGFTLVFYSEEEYGHAVATAGVSKSREDDAACCCASRAPATPESFLEHL
jgi:hypothetical protein